MTTTRFPIRYEASYAALSSALLIFPSASYIEIDGNDVSVRMSWAFRAKFDRSQVTRAAPLGKRIALTRGVRAGRRYHAWARCGGILDLWDSRGAKAP